MNKTVVIDDKLNEIEIPYYNIGEFAKKTVLEYISKDQNIKKEFDLFKEQYHFFEPYFDFLILKLNYQIKNPFIFEESILKEHHGHFTIKSLISYDYPSANDEDMMISLFDISNVDDEIINTTGLTYKVDRNKGYTHQFIYEIVLIERMIGDKDLYEDYISCISNDDALYYDVNSYFRNRLGYIQVTKIDKEKGFILYNPDVASGYLKSIANEIVTKYPQIVKKCDGSERYKTR